MTSGSTSSWRDVALEDVADELTVGYVGPMASEYVDDGIPFLRSLNVEALRINKNDLKFITPEFHQRIQKSRLAPGDVVIVRTGKPGACSVVPEWLTDANCSDLVIVRCGQELNNRFLAYYVNTVASGHVAAHLVGAVQQHFNVASARTLRLNLPPLREQEAIAAVLGALDDKIELNRRMNATLEAMARALFQSWFIDFDPTHAKRDGRQPTGLDAATAALFPDEFEDSELGPIPRGWRVAKISDVCTTQYGYTASATEEPTGPHLLRVTDINKQNWIDWSSVPYCAIPYEEKPRYALTPGDIVVARMADPGKSAIVEGHVDAVFASYLVRLKTASVANAYYVYYWLKSPAYTEYAAGAMSGSVQANMNANVIVAAELLLPPRAIADAFAERVTTLRQRIVASLKESRTLGVIRDALLPKLLSGEIKPQPN